MAGHGHHHVEGLITGKAIVKDIIAVCPFAETVLRRTLGPYALCMPGALTESIEFLAAMNDTHLDPILEEINAACGTAPHKVGHF